MTVTTDVMVIGTVRDYGDRALLLEFDSTAEVLAWTDALREADAARRAGHRSGVSHRADQARRTALSGPHPATAWEATRGTGGASSDSTALIEGRADLVIDVEYDGADLDEVARLTGLDPAQVVAAHTDTPWRVGFGGFAPGFAYLVGGDPRLNVPRRSEPRTKVPTGSVALAGEFSGVYPRESPGGWQLIGHTDAVLWDVERDNPALLTPGMWVQFRAVR